ncbi:hypothetical protein [Asanoa siamensis]|uniref:DUF4439 domain-containing protein n=1 Tax=Asanoa siamensis TaxID=926357 RepID=A0ABQ4CTG9_9ACTN|nr:hypothetical protein [Asanoa siamensis]GIF74593.1 hypothetical protein Asi02nite_41110 [Asanoa siamensis]
MSRKTGKPSYVRRDEQQRRRRVPLIAAIVAAAALLIVGGGSGFLAGRPDATSRAVEEIRKQEAVRDLAQIKELTTVARASQEALGKLLTELDTAAAGTRPASAAQVGAWKATVDGLVHAHADSPSGTTATNVARGGLRAAVDGFALAVDLYAMSLEVPAANRPALLRSVERAQRTASVGWSVAAAQLDQLNIDAGLGHQHVYLRTEQGSGAFTADGEPEGVPN